MKINLFVPALFLFLSFCCFAGCTSFSRNFGKTVDCTTPPGNRQIGDSVGPVKGSDTTWTIFRYMIGSPDLGEALDEAKKQKNADVILNAKITENSYSVFIFSVRRLTIEGDGYRLVDVPASQSEVKSRGGRK